MTNHTRSLLLAAGFMAIVVAAPTGAPGDEVTADALITEFYKWYPCVTPNPAFELGRRAPKVSHAIFDSSRPEKDRYAAFHLIVGARLTGWERVIRAAMSDRSLRIRASAVHNLHLVLPRDELVKEYIRLLDDESYSMRYYGAEMLQRYPTERAVRPLLNLFADESIETRHRAASTLLSWNNPDIRRAIQELSRSEDRTIAGVATCSLAGLKDEPVNIAALHSYLEQELQQLTGPPYSGAGAVTYIIHLIGEHGNESSLPVLKGVEKHEHRSVRQAGKKAIDEIQNLSGKGK